MPRYTYDGDWPAVFPTLELGVNAVVTPAPDAPEGSTVVLHPGDEVETSEPFESALLREAAAPAPAPLPTPASGEETAQ